jgi:hypothetical protein
VGNGLDAGFEGLEGGCGRMMREKLRASQRDLPSRHRPASLGYARRSKERNPFVRGSLTKPANATKMFALAWKVTGILWMQIEGLGRGFDWACNGFGCSTLTGLMAFGGVSQGRPEDRPTLV